MAKKTREGAPKSLLDGRVVLVTGALGILGRRFCDGFAEHGADVAVVDLDGEACAAAAAEIAATFGVSAVGVGCDVAEEASVAAMAGSVVGALGRINILMNNAATKGKDVRRFFTAFEDYPLDVWREVMSVNIDGMFLVAKHVGRRMISANSGGCIVQTSSIYGVVAPDERIYEGSEYLGGPINTPAVYSVSKAGVIGLSKYLAARWAKHGIRVNCLVPGGVGSGQNSTFSERYSARVPLGRMAQPNEIVAAALFLASDASSYVTGQSLVVDGGLSVW
jgi:NAD(P)-dependent dehydrogenase (short-subunit alcohol dehydrogenase family)